MRIRYFDHSATTPTDKRVLEKIIPYFSESYGNPSSIYTLGKINKEIINIYRNKIANILNCKPNEIYFTSGGSESDNLIIKGIAYANRRRGNHIITTSIEHPAVLNTCKTLEKNGFRISYIRPKPNGIIDEKDILRNINQNTVLISVMYANNEIGTIQPIKEVGEIAKKYNIFFHTDAVQAAGNIEINVRRDNIGALSLSSHKFYGPKGIGVAYINENIPFMRIQDGGHQEKDKRAGTENVPGIVGTGEALEIANKEMKYNNYKIQNMRNYYISEVKKRIPNIKINGDLEKRLPGNANISFYGINGKKLVEALDEKGICASSGSACSAGLINPSHVLLSIGVPENLAKSGLRITIGKENTIEDINYLVDNLENIIKKMRN